MAGKFDTCSLRLHPLLDVLVIPQKHDPCNTYIYIYDLVKKGWNFLFG